MDQAGAYALTSVAKLINADIAYPGERWSDAKANELIVPGEGVVTINNAGKLYVRRATVADIADKRIALATRTVQIPDRNLGSQYNEALGPNEIMNLAIPIGEYVLRHYSGAFNLTLVKPDTYVPSDLLIFDDTATRPTGKGGTGSWRKAADATERGAAFFEVSHWRPVNNLNEGILTVRSTRGQF
jgi:hypothetical protein